MDRTHARNWSYIKLKCEVSRELNWCKPPLHSQYFLLTVPLMQFFFVRASIFSHVAFFVLFVPHFCPFRVISAGFGSLERPCVGLIVSVWYVTYI